MKRKLILFGGAIAACAALGVFAFSKFHHGAAAGDDESADENVPTVVAVQVGALQRVTLRRYVSGYGTIEAAPATATTPAADAPLAPPTAGVVAKVKVAAGQRVAKGDVLLELNSSTTTFANAQAELERQKKLFAEHNTSLKSLQDAEAQLASLEVVAPLAGTVVRVNVKPGQAVDVSTIVAEVMDLNRLAVTTKIPAAAAGELKPGQEVLLLSQPPVTAALSFVSPAVDANDGTVSAWAALPANGGLRPGEFVPLKIVTAVHTNCLAAPAASVITDENGRSILSLVHGEEATQTPVQTGLREDGWVEIAAPGLQAGDSVVTVGAYGLPAKTKIQIVHPPAEAAATNSPEAQ
jgi:multidrug efflux pump subunit AcrA (membrane-fusion protein)